MERFDRNLLLLLPMALFAASCGTMRSTTASVDDDVYFMPSTAPVYASTDRSAAYEEPAVEEPAVEEPAQPAPTDDYYNEGASQSLGTDGGYYDMTYNDPYYYNYGRFGFNAAPMGWQTGWNGPGWGGGMYSDFGWYNGFGWGSGWQGVSLGWGYGTSMFNGWYRPGWVYNPYISPNPWGWNNWGYGGWGGMGYGNYYNSWGNCYSCYTPVVVGDSWSSTVVAPRRPTGGSGSSVGNTTRRVPVRNSVGLIPQTDRRTPSVSKRTPAVDPVTRQPSTAPGRTQPAAPPTRTRERGAPARDNGHSAPSRNFDGGGGGGRSTPAPGRGGGGGGTRSTPGRR